jgi:roadblock/LC7 domain-containing protein
MFRKGASMLYKGVKENDGTYSIRESVHGGNWSVCLMGVRGCNVNKTINRLIVEDDDREFEKKRQAVTIQPEG